MNLRLRLLLEWLLIGAAGSLLVIFALSSGGASSFDNLFYDRLSSIQRPAADKRVLLINIDQKSLDAIGKWPWKRSVHAQLLRQLQTAGPRTVTLDVIFSENGDAADDAALATAMAAQTAPVFLPLHFDTPGDDGRAYNIAMPIPAFANAAATGHVNIHFDDDGKVRRGELCFDPENDGKSWPHVMELVYRGLGKSASPAYQKNSCGQSLLIPYAKRGSHSEISYIDALQGNIPRDLIAGRDVIVGASAAGMGDSYPVPYADGALLAGSEIMANMLTAIRKDNFTQQVTTLTAILLSLLPMWLLLFGFLRWLPRTALLLSLALVVLILSGSAAALMVGFWFPPGTAVLSIMVIYPLWGWRRLQAMSNFLGHELTQLEQEDTSIPLYLPKVKAGDLVGRQSAALAEAIDHMRDLRVFMKNTLSDLPDPMVATDISGKITLASDLTEQRLGFTIVGMLFDDALKALAAPEYQPAIFEYLAKAKNMPDSRYVLDEEAGRDFIRFQTRDGGSFVMRQSPIETALGVLQGYIYYLTDITALANAQEEREQVLQLLSHDMRAPQSAIIAALDGVIDDAARKRIGNNAQRTMRLAQDFVDMARMGETDFAGEELLILDLVRDVTDSFWALAKEREVKFDIEDQAELTFVLGEFDSLTRAFSNLIDNAIKFSPLGGHISIIATRIETSNHPMIRIEMRNDGNGIDAEILPRLFQRFVSSNEKSGRVMGTGLGLNYVHAVVGRHKGRISAANLATGGCCFTIELPIAPEN
jgi:CHASE2 domain-containing sensor protein/signal transduction histidine kinase